MTTALGGRGGAAAAQPPIGLGTAARFAVLAGSTVTSSGPSAITGDVGVSPGAAITGFPPGTVSGGTIHAADAVAAQAEADLTTAYNDAAGRPASGTITADLAGQSLGPGVYAGTTLALNGTLILDAKGDANAIFIFQSASTLITGTGSSVVLIGGADACNVVWQVGSSATLGTASTFVGSVLALTSATANTGATVSGRLLARNAAVTLDSNAITRPTCTGPPPTTTTTAPATTTTSTAPTTTTTTAPTTTTTTAPTTTTTTTAPTTTTTAPTTTTTTLPATTTTTTTPTTTTTLPATTTTTAPTTTTTLVPTSTTTAPAPSTGTSGAWGGAASSTGTGGGTTGASRPVRAPRAQGQRPPLRAASRRLWLAPARSSQTP